MSLATSMGPGCCHQHGTTGLRGEDVGWLGLVSTSWPAGGLVELSDRSRTAGAVRGPRGLMGMTLAPGGRSRVVTAGSLPLPVGLAFDDEFVGGGGEPVDG